MKRAIAVFVGLLALISTSAAQTPVAIVEVIQGKVTGAEFMDYLTPKTVIKLGNNSSIVISYLKSCRRERIEGIGTVIIGTEESVVHLASVKEDQPQCDANHANTTTRDTNGVAATAFRGVGSSGNSKMNHNSMTAQLTLYGASPLVQATGHGTLVVERLDERGERLRIDLNGKQLKGKFYDFDAHKQALSPGGIYLAKFKSSQIVFEIDAHARPGATPLVGRLLVMD
ncbi:hypothetical protein [Bradyrhizobium sp. JYMT SZCCT0428]|uniref:hypothetical protein n=1 Tax=Bradyrhizobium sp. JYMT SZCCT0428 TaxID=2807673 RepID=UPI001BAB201F|nr:hypothetical protein [Bradyrhizobium sp. JYMT SZCCT0428]MBR1157203.1 hypothetical protein [Bradyrhizobium sp. JYMT SZCCT0428]